MHITFFNYHSYKENCGFCLMMLESVVMDLVIFIFLLLPFFLFFFFGGVVKLFPLICYIFSVIYVLCFYLKHCFTPSYSVNFRCWTGNVAATKKKWLFWWADPSQFCTYCPHHCKWFFFPPNLRDTALICTTTTFYKLLYWKWSFVQVTFFINNFPSFLMAKIAFEIGLFLSLGFGWNLYAVSNSYSILHICPAWRWERKALPTTWHLITGF